MVQSPTCSPASASPSSSCGDALLAGLSLPVQYKISHRPFHFPCASGLACGSPLEPRATSTVSVRGTLWLRISRTTCGFHGGVQEGFTGTPEVSCGPMRGLEACITHYFHLHGLWIPWESRAHVRPVVAPDEVHQLPHLDQVTYTMTVSTVAQSD